MAIKKSVLFTACFMLLLSGCARTPQPHSVTELVAPEDEKGKACAVECKKMLIMEKQLINSEFVASSIGRGRIGQQTREVGRDLDTMTAESNYRKCIIDYCGGRAETKIVVY